MRIVYAGTPSFALPALEALHSAGHEVVLVLAQPDRPAGRGMRTVPGPVVECAQRLGLPTFQPASLREPDSWSAIRSAAPEILVVAAYGLILPQGVLDIAGRGGLNIHASLLPRWRGAAPVVRAILAGDRETGISIMRMEAGLDTGPVVLERRVSISDRDNAGALTDRLAQVGAEAIVDALARLDDLPAIAQDPAGACYAPKVSRSEARIDWRRSAVEIDRQIRAFDPAPGAECDFGGIRLKIWTAHPRAGRGEPGKVLSLSGGEVQVGCGEGVLSIALLQKPGGRRMGAAELLHGLRTTADGFFR